MTGELKDIKVLIIGLGKTGLATARFFARRGAEIVVTDEKTPAALGEAYGEIEALRKGAFVAYGSGALTGVNLVVPSPGVPPRNALLAESVRKGIPIQSELEVAARRIRVPIIAVTGTNGKTTTTTLIGKILEACGKKVFVGGNIGNPLIGYLDGPQDDDYIVCEVSSFQLQWAESFRPQVAILLNTTCDHVDYHGSFEAYRLVKESVFRHQQKGDFAILNATDPSTARLSESLSAGILFFSSIRKATPGIFLEGGDIVQQDISGKREAYPLSMIKIPGKHNIENVMASILATRVCGCSPDGIEKAVAEFKGMPHRIEYVAENRGVRFYDDSKGTNVGAVQRALETFPSPIILLLGGRDKEGDFETLRPLIRERVRELIIFGEARERIDSLVGGVVNTALMPTLKEAIMLAWGKSRAGDVVLLSPGCASFDEFSDYKARGRFFQEVVRSLPDE
ncbi:MAG: UDP-N-acetylmuramoyl-L-alanine--D-glutamate ligase, partial [Smithellaceae bacterium]|nr:UDP-N-acetylmuramoyl-L-alanine--D-glutamate ligase [Smithellaceae bacterium]